jgi:PPM family protein phosphatase
MRPDAEDSTIPGLDHGFAPDFFVPSSPPMRVDFGGASHVGLVRKSNEDHFAVFRRIRMQDVLLTNLAPDDAPPNTSAAYCLVVADGIGGAAGGETASRVAVRRAFDLTDHASSWVMRLSSLVAQQIQERVDAYLTEIHHTLRAMAEADPDLAGMGTTWTSVYVVGWNALIVQIGDSRAYLWSRDTLRQLTHDQTLAQVLIDTGIPAEETMGVRHILTNSLGAKDHLIVPLVGHLGLRNGDRLLLCTDGLTDEIPQNQIIDVLRSISNPQAACDGLVQLGLDHGGSDNITVVLADFHAARDEINPR